MMIARHTMTPADPANDDQLVDRNEILPLLANARRSGEWMMAYCPVHNDGSKHNGNGGQSLGLSDKGVLRCFAGCDFKDVINALRGGSTKITPFRADAERLVKVYSYVDADGVVLAEKGRFETGDGRKSFRWRLPGVEAWKGGVSVAELPLYGVALLRQRPADPVYFVEGEKACEACWEHGLLAVTHAGGAGIKDFGRSLEALKGRTVYLWPDNDAPGRSHMNMIKARLEGIAGDVRIINVAVPEKGDAWDYFFRGGKTDDIEAASPTVPSVHVLAEDSIQVVVPTLAGPVTFTFSEMEKSTRDLDAELSIACFAFPSNQPYCERINLLSATARTELRRSLESICGKEYGWPQVLNTAFGLARETYLKQDRGIEAFDIPDPVGDVLMLAPLLVSGGPTIFFGDGSSLKSYLIFKMLVCMALGISFCGMQTPARRVLFIDYEDDSSNVKRRLNRIVRGISPIGDAPLFGFYYWDARGIPLKDQVEAIKRKCEKDGIGLIAIDSAGPACGGPPEDAVAALAFFRALKKIGLPSIIIAHITKGTAGEANTQKPFGSVYWHNEARRTWFVKRVQEEDSDELDVGLFCRKVNDGRLPPPLAFHASFEGSEGPVRITLGTVERVPELLDQTNDRNRVWMALEGGPRTITDISTESGLDYKRVETALGRGPFVQVGTASSTGRGRPAAIWARRTDREG